MAAIAAPPVLPIEFYPLEDQQKVVETALQRAEECDSERGDLRLSGKGVADVGVSFFIPHQAVVAKCKAIDLFGNHISPRGASILSVMLLTPLSLRSLELGQNQIGVAGVTILAKSLAANRTLTFLGLSYTHQGEKGIKALGKALEWNRSLVCLDVRGPIVGEAIATVLVTSLEWNRSLRDLYFTVRGYISHNGSIRKIAALVRQNDESARIQSLTKLCWEKIRTYANEATPDTATVGYAFGYHLHGIQRNRGGLYIEQEPTPELPLDEM